MKLLLIGGTGIISADITRLAATRDDIDLYLLNRGSLPHLVPKGVKLITADINDRAAVLSGIDGLEFDVVADFISYTVPSLEQKLALFRGRCRQYMFISSCAAYRPPSAFMVQTEANSSIGNPLWSYGLNKALCEQRLAEECGHCDMCYTHIRPAYTYNNIRILHPYTINHWRSWTVAQRLIDGKPYVLHDDGQQLCTATHAEDFAKAFLGLCGNPAAMNQDFHITSSEYVTWKHIGELTAEILGVKPTFCFVPSQTLFLELGQTAGEKIMATAQHAVYDSAKVAAAVPGFSCSISFPVGLERTLKFYLDHPEYQKIDETWDRDFDRIAERCGHV